MARKTQNHKNSRTIFGYSIMMLWIPDHHQMFGNEKKDKKYREAITHPRKLYFLPTSPYTTPKRHSE